MGSALAVSAAAIIGFLGGLFTFRQKCRWCPACGATYTCTCTAGQARR